MKNIKTLGAVSTKFISDQVYLKKPLKKKQRGQSIVAHLRGSATARMTTDEIMALTRQKAKNN